MIIKSFETQKINLDSNKFILFHGDNEGLKSEKIKELIKNRNGISKYEEKEILDNQNNFIESILSGSLFENEKVIIIKRATDKIIKIIEELSAKNIEHLMIIISAESLNKKSKLRSFFEKEKKYVCVAFYPDNEQTLTKLAYNFLREKNVPTSSADINIITNKCNGDREALLNELKKIEYFSKNGKKITSENISKIINLRENHSISELIDYCLAKNKKKIISILNENNFSNDDCIMITRSFLIKAKKLLTLSTFFESSKNIDLTISSAKPPIFWKEKEITKQQIYKWKPKNINNSINLITDFILSQSSSEANS